VVPIIGQGCAPVIPADGINQNPPVHSRTLQQQILALSDLCGQWEAFALQLAADAYAAGYSDGQYGRPWTPGGARPPLPDLGGPTHAELEVLRYGPAGRAAFGRPRPGDFPGTDPESWVWE
jgi:hypothetical protein